MNHNTRTIPYAQAALDEAALRQLTIDAQLLVRIVHKANANATTLGGITLSGPVLSQWRVSSASSEAKAWSMVERLRRTGHLNMLVDGNVEYLVVGWRLGSPDLDQIIAEGAKTTGRKHPPRPAVVEDGSPPLYTKLSTLDLAPADALIPAMGPRQQGRNFTQVPSLVTHTDGTKVAVAYRPPVRLGTSTGGV